eukprot:47642_1
MAKKLKCCLRVLIIDASNTTDLGTMLISTEYDADFCILLNTLKGRMSDKYSNLIYRKNSNPSLYIESISNIESTLASINNMNGCARISDWNDAISDLYNQATDIILVTFATQKSIQSIANKAATHSKQFESKTMQQWTTSDIAHWIDSLYSLNQTFKTHLISGLNLYECNGWDLLHCQNEYELSEALNVPIVIGRRLFYLIQSHLNNPRYNFTPLKNLDLVSFAIIQSIQNAPLVQIYNLPKYIVRIIFHLVYASSNDVSLWLDANDSSTLTLDEQQHVLKWKSKSNDIVLTPIEKHRYCRPSPASHHAKNANEWGMPRFLREDDMKHKNIGGVQYSYQQTHRLSRSITIGAIFAVFKYKRINQSCTFYIFGHHSSCVGALHGSHDGANRRAGKYIAANDTNEFYCNGEKLQPSKVCFWENEYKIASLGLHKAVEADRIGAERKYHAFEGVLAECIVYSRKIEQFEREAIEQYFKNKYKFI